MVTSANRGDTTADRGEFAAVEARAPAAPVVPVPSVVRLFSGPFVPPQAATQTVNVTTCIHFFTFYPPSWRNFDLDRIAERRELRPD
jgi:hypothetical protein